MSSKGPCKGCGKPILDFTAAKTGGYCIPCNRASSDDEAPDLPLPLSYIIVLLPFILTAILFLVLRLQLGWHIIWCLVSSVFGLLFFSQVLMPFLLFLLSPILLRNSD